MQQLTREHFIDTIESVWKEGDVTGVVMIIQFLNHYVETSEDEVSEDRSEDDEAQFYGEHVNEQWRVTKETLLNLVDLWCEGACTIKTIVEFLDNYVEGPEFAQDEYNANNDFGYESYDSGLE